MNRTCPDHVRPEDRKFYATTQIAYLFGAGGHFGLGLIFLYLRVPELVGFNFLVSVPAFGLALVLNRRGRHAGAFTLAFLELLCHQAAALYYLGWASGFQYYLVYLAGLAFFNARWRGKVRLLLLALVFAAFAVLYLTTRGPRPYVLAPSQYAFLYLTCSLSTLLALALLINHYVQAAAAAEGNLLLANQRLEEQNDAIARALGQRDAALGRLNRELADAAEYVRTLLPPPIPQGPVRIDWRYLPSTSLGGDAFGYHWRGADRLVLYLIDVSGHGVGAALLSVSVANALRSESLPDTDFDDPAGVLAALNRAFPSEAHNDMFFTIWYGVYHRPTRELRFAGGGHPPALLAAPSAGEGRPLTRLGEPNFVIGSLPEVRYRPSTLRLEAGSRLYVFSDGAYEIRRPDGSMGRLEDLAIFLGRARDSGASRLDRLLEHVTGPGRSKAFEDDVTILEVVFE